MSHIYIFKHDIFFHSRCLLNIADIENYTNLHDMLPHSWSLPSLGNALRHEIEPPVLQQATFDEVVRIDSDYKKSRLKKLIISKSF